MKLSDFDELAASAYRERKPHEFLILNLRGEESDFIRVNHAKVRQWGRVQETQISIDYLLESSEGLRKSSASFVLSGMKANDTDRLKRQIQFLRDETKDLPVDPYAELPLQSDSHQQISKGRLLDIKNALPDLLGPLQKLDAVGIYSGGRMLRAMSHSEGLRHWFETENFIWDYSVYTSTQRAYKEVYAGNEWSAETYAAQIDRLQSALSALEAPARTVNRGRHRVYLAPAAVGELLGMWSWGCMGESAFRNGESPLLKLRSGDSELSPLFSLAEDFRNQQVPRFNAEGEVSPEVLPLIQSGKLKSTLVSRRSSKEFGLPSTAASASEALRSPHIERGRLNEKDVLRELHDGLYISNLHYLNWSDQPEGRVTGMTRFSCFEVKGGVLKAPIETMRFDETLFSVFGADLEALTSEAGWQPETSTYQMRSLGGASAPGLLLKGFELTI